MKLLIVRHGDPDYDIDSLTEKGWKEVEYLSREAVDIVKDFNGDASFLIALITYLIDRTY